MSSLIFGDLPTGVSQLFLSLGGYLEARPNNGNSGEARRIPLRTETGYPRATDSLFTKPTVDIHADTMGGADQGFANCYRDVYLHYLSNLSNTKSRASQVVRVQPRERRIYIDDNLVGTTPVLIGEFIAERDEYLWKHQSFQLEHELGAMQ